MRWLFIYVAFAVSAMVVSKVILVPSSLFSNYLAHDQRGLDVIIPGVIINGLCIYGEREETQRCMSPFGEVYDNYCDFIGCDQWDPGDEEPIDPDNLPHGRHCDYEPSLEYSNMLDETQIMSIGNELVLTSTWVGAWCTRKAYCEAGEPDPTKDCNTAEWDQEGILGIWPGFCEFMGFDPLDPEADQGFVGFCRPCWMREPSGWDELNTWMSSAVDRKLYFDEPCPVGGGPITP